MQWWLCYSIKPKAFRVYRCIVAPVGFLSLVTFIALMIDKVWLVGLAVILPIVVVDFVWDIINFINYKKNRSKDELQQHENKLADINTNTKSNKDNY